VHCQERVEEISQPNALCFGHQPEDGAITVESPVAARVEHSQPMLIAPEKKLFAWPTGGLIPVEDGRTGRSMPLHVHNGYSDARYYALDVGANRKALEKGQPLLQRCTY
jgi:hypothetical protein